MGLVVVTAWGAEHIAALRPGETVDIANYRLTFEGVFGRNGPNYHDVVGRFVVRRTSGELLGIMEPSRRTFPARAMATTEAALMRRGVSQIYLSLGDPNPDGTVPVRLYYKPRVLMIWLGAVFMFVGGGLSLSDRRLRVGAPTAGKENPRGAAGGGVNADAAPCHRFARMAAIAVALLAAALSSATPLFAVEPGEMLKDPVLEARARTLSKELRCMVCQNQSIDDSEAPLAHDLRVLVRERLTAGDSDAQVIDFLVARYGEFVLLKPPLSWHTAALWGLPPAILLLGVAAIVIVVGRRRSRRRAGAGEPHGRRRKAAVRAFARQRLKSGASRSRYARPAD